MIVKNSALLFYAPDPAIVATAIPNHKRLRIKGQELMAVRHGLDEVRVLRNLGFDAPSPMLYDGYQFPGMFPPMAHQYDTATFLTLNPRAFVLSEMGTGKTASAIWAVDYLKARGKVRKVLIVCPVSVIKVWADELFKVAPHLTAVQVQGHKAKRMELLSMATDVTIVNFDGLTFLSKEFEAQDYDLVIVDEASAYRNAGNKRYQALKKLIKPHVSLWLMTGTPTPNAPTDAWALCKLISPKRVPASFKIFQETVMRQAGPYKFVPKIGSTAIVYDVLQPAIRFLKSECLDLPPVTYSNRHCEFSDEQAKLFESIKRKMKHEAEDGNEITAVNAAVKVLKLQQICCGVVKDDAKEPVWLNPKPRLELLEELIEQSGGKVIVFVPFLFSMDMVAEHLSKRWTVAVVNGNVGTTARGKIFDDFQKTSDPHVLIAHPATTAHGLTLTAANTIIWYAPIYSIEQYEQANARIDRPGQKLAMSIYHIGAHPFEWAIYKALQGKGAIQNALLSMYRQIVGDND